jgi:transglutaminase-like putative cysteine protease
VTAMRIKISHETRYHFEVSPSHLVQRLHLKPTDFASQKTLHWKITAPGIEGALEYVDGFGNWVHLVTAENPSREAAVIAEGEVETQDSAGVVRGLATHVPDAVYLRQTETTMPDTAMLAAVKPLRGKKNVLETGHGLMALVHEAIAYEIGTSHAHTTAAESFNAGRGVCQDHAQVVIGMARALQIPARYVTGYLVTGVGASAAAAHAWAELLVPDLGWVGFDAANSQCPTEHYVRLASGLDAGAVTPIKGSRRGGIGSEHLTVAVRAEIEQQ